MERLLFLETHRDYLSSREALLALYPLKDRVLAHCKSLLFRLLARQETHCCHLLSSLHLPLPLQPPHDSLDPRLSDYLLLQALNSRHHKASTFSALFPELASLWPSAHEYPSECSPPLVNLVKFLYDQSRASHEISLLLKNSVEDYYSRYRLDMHRLVFNCLQAQVSPSLEAIEVRHAVYLVVEVLYYEDMHYSRLVHPQSRKYASILLAHLGSVLQVYLPLLQSLVGMQS